MQFVSLRAARGIHAGPAIGLSSDRGKVRWTPAGRQRPLVDSVRSVLIEIILHRSGEAAHADRGNDPRVAALLYQLKTGDVLALGAEVVSGAWTRPIVASVIGEVESRLRTRDDVIAVVGVDAHFADCLILRKSSRRQRIARAENTRP